MEQTTVEAAKQSWDLLPMIQLIITAIVIPLIAVVWQQAKARIDRLEKRMDQMNEERKKNIDKLFDKIDEVNNDLSDTKAKVAAVEAQVTST